MDYAQGSEMKRGAKISQLVSISVTKTKNVSHTNNGWGTWSMNDVYRWYDEETNTWIIGTLIKGYEDMEKLIRIPIYRQKGDDSCLLEKHIHSSKLLQHDFGGNFEIDHGLKNLLETKEFHYGRDGGVVLSGILSMKESILHSNYGIFNHLELGNSAKMIYIKEVNRIYFVDIKIDNCWDIYYYDATKNMHKPWELQPVHLDIIPMVDGCNPLEECWGISCVTYVKPRIFLIWLKHSCCRDARIYYVDIMSGRMVRSRRSSKRFIDVGDYISAYDDQNETIYLLSKLGKKHKSVALKDIFSWWFYRDVIVYWFIWKIEKELYVLMPSELKKLVDSYVAFE